MEKIEIIAIKSIAATLEVFAVFGILEGSSSKRCHCRWGEHYGRHPVSSPFFPECPNMIGTSDFLTGAFPAEYGNALAGVFDINLRTATKTATSSRARWALSPARRPWPKAR